MNRKTTFLSPIRFIALSLCCLLLALVGCSHTQTGVDSTLTVPFSPSTATGKPYLQLETRRHTATIRRIAVDAGERYLVSASEDKTARVWELSSGKLLQTLRPPLGDGNEGKLYAIAISPDGAEVAVGGFTGKDNSYDWHIYFFDTVSGRLLRQIGQLPEVVNHLAYSAEGKYLAAALHGANGIRVYDSTGLRQVSSDLAYSDSSYWVEFDRSGRLLSSSFDGYIRLYDQNFKLIKKQAPTGGKQPYAARFSPEGDKIAVGFHDVTAVDVLATDSLALLYAADTRAFNNNSLDNVAWSADGQELYAGGTYVDGVGNCPIIKWPQAGRGVASILPAANNTVMGIRSLSQNRLAYGTADPAWGVMDNTGVKRIETTPVQVDHRQSSPDKLLLSADASVVEFISGGKAKAFSLLDVHYLNATDGLLSHAKTSAPGLTVTDWENKTSPKLNGKAISLKNYEISRRLAITADAQHFVLGADWTLRFYDRLGQQLWPPIVTPATAWAVNISRDQRFAVAAFGDGTIRWYSLKDGKEQLAFFPKNNGADWVMWTPEGFFNTGGNGKELVGYALNQGQNKEAQFVAVSQLYDSFYRPDLIAKRLEQTDEAEAIIQQAVAKIGDVQTVLKDGPPPSLEMVASEQRGSELLLKFRATDHGGGIGNIRYRVNGVEQETRQVFPGLVGLEPNEIRIPLSQSRNKVELFAYNKNNTVPSQSLTAEANLSVADPVKPSLYVLALGVSRYQDPRKNLKFADADANAFAAMLKTGSGQLFKDKHIVTLTNEQVTLAALSQRFAELAGQVQTNDVFVLYLAGHGLVIDASYHFIPSDAVYTSERAMHEASLSEQRLRELLTSIKALKSVIFLDTCFAGSLKVADSKPTLLAAGDSPNDRVRGDYYEEIAITRLREGTGRAVLSAASGEKLALEGYQGHGYFTYALLDGLKGAADIDKDRQVDVQELSSFLGKAVPKLSNNRQFPVLETDKLIDFPIGITQ